MARILVFFRSSALVLWLTLLAAGLAPSACAALQGYANGHLLDAWCRRDEALDKEACLSYLRGVFDTVAAAQEIKSSDTPGRFESLDAICIPRNVPVTQIRIVFRRYAEEHPHELHIQAALVVIRALRAAFPCEVKERANPRESDD